jgi:hypothetical protein
MKIKYSFRSEEHSLKKTFVQLGTKFRLPNDIVRLLFTFYRKDAEIKPPPGINPRISHEVYLAIYQNFLKVCLQYTQHPREDLIYTMLKFMSCEEEEENMKIGIDETIQRGYDPRFWHQLGPPPELSRGVIEKVWLEREKEILEEITPTRWPILYNGSFMDPLRHFTEFIDLLKTASETGYSISKKNGLRLKPCKLSLADCELLRNITSTPGRESSSSRAGYSKRITRSLFWQINKAMHGYRPPTPKIICHHWSPNFMDYREKKAILDTWVEFFKHFKFVV